MAVMKVIKMVFWKKQYHLEGYTLLLIWHCFWGLVNPFGVLYGCLEVFAFVYASISRHLTQLYSSFGATLKDQVCW